MTMLLLSPKVSNALQDPLRRDYLEMLDNLRALDTPIGRELLECWQTLGSAVGVSEKALRADAETE